MKLTPRRIKYLKRLHNLVIHKVKGSNMKYFKESRELDKLTLADCYFICSRCFGKKKR